MMVDIRDLREKVRLLYGRAECLDKQGNPVKDKDGKIVKIVTQQQHVALALGLHATDLSKCLSDRKKTPPYLSLTDIPAFLQLFGVTGVPAKVSPGSHWETLAAAPLLEFCRRVHQLSGIDWLSSPWDEFVAEEALRSTTRGGSITVDSAPEKFWRRGLMSLGSTRFLLPGQPNPAEPAPSDLPMIFSGDQARIKLNVGRLLAGQSKHLLMFQDIVYDSDHTRHFVPMLPSPPTAFIPPRLPFDSAVIDFPALAPNGEQQFVPVPAGWGLRRRLVAVVTEEKIGSEIYSPEEGWEMRPDRLDQLASSLKDSKHRSWGLFVYDYLVQARTAAVARL